MSSIAFHSPSGEARVRGWERASFGVLTDDLCAKFMLSNYPSEADRAALRELCGVEVGRDPALFLRHDWKPWFTIALNTTLRVGSDPIKLAARIHGQCEVHCWVAGKNRTWLAGIMEQGREIGFYREDSGWEAVISLLRSREDEPVVLSYSVCDSFPNSNQLEAPEGADPEAGSDWFYDLPPQEAWDRAFAALVESDGGLELTPDHWGDFYFSPNESAFEWRARLNARAKELGSKDAAP